MRTCYPVFFFNDTATTEIYTLSLHDALPISFVKPEGWNEWSMVQMYLGNWSVDKHIFLTNLTKNNQFYNSNDYYQIRSEEHTSELQSRQYLVCRLLLEKKKKCSLYTARV